MSKGDEQSFTSVFLHYQDHIFKIAYDFVKSHALAEEIVQDIFLKVWEKRENLHVLDSFQNWLFIISKNHLVSTLHRMALDRKMRDKWLGEQPLHDNSVDFKLRETYFSDVLRRIIGSLPTQQQAVFRLAKEEFYSYSEIAERLGISPNTVRIHMSRALMAIRASLKRQGIEYPLLFAASSMFF